MCIGTNILEQLDVFSKTGLEAASYSETFVRMYQSARRLRPVLLSLVFSQVYFVEIKRRYLIFPL